MKKENIAAITKELEQICVTVTKELGLEEVNKPISLEKLFRQNVASSPMFRKLKRRLEKYPDDRKTQEIIETIKEGKVTMLKTLRGTIKKLTGPHGAPSKKLLPTQAREACAFASSLHGQGWSLKSALREAAVKYNVSLRTMQRRWSERKEYFTAP